MRILVFCLIMGMVSTSFGFGGRRFSQPTHYYPQYYYQPQTYTEKIVIPVREQKIAEVANLKVFEDNAGLKWIVIDGKIYSRDNWQQKYFEDLKERKENNKITIEKQITY